MAGIALCFLLCGCQQIEQFIPNNDVTRFGTDRKFPDLNYTGDGNFTDYGRKAAIMRFFLDLGEVDLKEASVQTHELNGLPAVKFVCYLRVDHPLPLSGKPNDFKAGDTVMEMILKDQDGKEVFSEKTPRRAGNGRVPSEPPKATSTRTRPCSLPRKAKPTKLP